METISQYLDRLHEVIDQTDSQGLERLVELVLMKHASGNTIYLMGNGGSAATASHFACDLGKGTAVEGVPRLRVLALTDNVPVMTAWANDSAYEDIFSEQLENFCRRDDLVVGISGSGNSPNVLRGMEVARRLGAYRVGITGFQGGKLVDCCDLSLVVPSSNMQRIEDVHMIIAHAVSSRVRDEMMVRATRTGVEPTPALALA